MYSKVDYSASGSLFGEAIAIDKNKAQKQYIDKRTGITNTVLFEIVGNKLIITTNIQSGNHESEYFGWEHNISISGEYFRVENDNQNAYILPLTVEETVILLGKYGYTVSLNSDYCYKQSDGTYTFLLYTAGNSGQTLSGHINVNLSTGIALIYDIFDSIYETIDLINNIRTLSNPVLEEPEPTMPEETPANQLPVDMLSGRYYLVDNYTNEISISKYIEFKDDTFFMAIWDSESANFTGVYRISGNTLTLTVNGGTISVAKGTTQDVIISSDRKQITVIYEGSEDSILVKE